MNMLSGGQKLKCARIKIFFVLSFSCLVNICLTVEAKASEHGSLSLVKKIHTLPDDLYGTWLFTYYSTPNSSVSLHETDVAGKLKLSFSKTEIGFASRCNLSVKNAYLSDNVLSISESHISTMRACAPEHAEEESEILGLLTRTSRYFSIKERAYFFDNTGALLFALKRAKSNTP